MTKKAYKTEWSFSFDKMGDTIRNAVEGLKSEEVSDIDLRFDSFSEPLNGRTEASIYVAFSMGKADINSLVASNNLFEADINYIGEVEFKTGEAPDYTVMLHQPDSKINEILKKIKSLRNDNDKLRWDVRLSPEIPLILDVKGGLGKSTLNLTNLNLTRFTLNTNVGATEIFLPTSETEYEADIETNVGKTEIHLQEKTSIDLDIEGGVGAVTVYVPSNAAVKLKAKVGVGKLEVPARFQKQDGKRQFVSEEGEWITEGFDDAQYRITIDYQGGVGKFEVIEDTAIV